MFAFFLIFKTSGPDQGLCFKFEMDTYGLMSWVDSESYRFHSIRGVIISGVFQQFFPNYSITVISSIQVGGMSPNINTSVNFLATASARPSSRYLSLLSRSVKSI